jgi:hypothetical protein
MQSILLILILLRCFIDFQTTLAQGAEKHDCVYLKYLVIILYIAYFHPGFITMKIMLILYFFR